MRQGVSCCIIKPSMRIIKCACCCICIHEIIQYIICKVCYKLFKNIKKKQNNGGQFAIKVHHACANRRNIALCALPNSHVSIFDTH